MRAFDGGSCTTTERQKEPLLSRGVTAWIRSGAIAREGSQLTVMSHLSGSVRVALVERLSSYLHEHAARGRGRGRGSGMVAGVVAVW